MNSVLLTGILNNIQEMTNNVCIGIIKDEKKEYIIFWEKQLFDITKYIDNYIYVNATIETIKVVNDNNVTKYITAFKVKEVEIINDI